MRKYFTLTKCLLKESGANFSLKMSSKGKGGRLSGIFLWLLLGVCFLPLLGMLYMMFSAAYEIFAPIGQLDYLTGVAFNVVCLVVFIFALIQTPSIFYLSKDIEYLLPLPLSPAQIIGAKFTVSLIYEYLMTVAFLGPMFAVYIQHMNPLLFGINGLLALLTLPVVPLAYAAILVMILMRVTNLGKNKDVMTYIVSFAAIGISLSINLFVQRLNYTNSDEMIHALESGAPLFNVLTFVFPNVRFAAASAANLNIIDMLLNLAVVAVSICVFLLLAERLYLKGVVGLTEGAASKKISRDDLLGKVKSRKVFSAYLIKEFKLLFRSPTAFMNCVAMIVLMPAIMMVSFLSQPATRQFLTNVDFTSNDGAIGVAFIIAAVIGVFLPGMCFITSTAISREGRNYTFIKYIPVKYKTQINAKVCSGLVITLIGLVATWLALGVFLHIPVFVLICSIALGLPGVVFINYAGIMIDLMHPKLEWDDEQAAIKRNMNAVIVILLAGVVVTALIIAGVFLYKEPLILFCLLFGVLTAAAAALYGTVMYFCGRLIEKL